ncbi:protein kinase [Archangium violaceum]|uniref:serine/threonine protein kinase n=1 Tax=Archangium violaceum TaxID=83451 RepID=UPI00194F77EC|nr:serine/threonine-protein kinase [Archangium violaceum]QRN93772.1 protein kinase [Archangium violaceum]
MANQGPQGSAGLDYDRGRRIGKYEIVTRLSMGGMAELFLAFTAGPGGFRKFVALKQILPDVQKDDQFVKMFLDEARITASLAHANIGQVFDLGDQDGELYLAMEFLAGQNLEQVLVASSKQQRPLPLGFSARAVRDACLGLHYAHSYTDPSGKPRPVVHRDVSPKNIMVTFDGNVKVIDFGIAKAKGRLGRTQVGMVKGTTGYMSPEQVRGSEQLDGRSDLFCMGVILHEMLCGRRLFSGAHEAEVMMKIADAEVTSPSSINPRVPEALAQVVMRALAREPAERFASGREMARAIEAACGAELFHEEQLAAVMRQLFADKIQKTRELLESANEGDPPTGQFAAPVLPSRSANPTSPPRAAKPTSGQVTPAPKPALSSGPKPAQRRPTSTSTPTAAPAPQRTPPPRSGSFSRPQAAAPEPDEEEDDELAKTRPVRRQPVVRAPGGADASEDSEPRTLPARAPVPRPEAPREGSGWGGRIFLLLLLAAIGGAIYYPPTRALLTPLYAAALKELKGEELPNGPPPAEPLPVTAPPEAAEQPALAQQEPAPVQEPEPRPEPEPEAVAAAEPPSKSRADTRKTRNPATTAPKPGTEPKPAAGSKSKPVAEAKPAPEPPTDGEPVLLDTSTARGAAKAELGFLTLYTVPRSAVFEGDNRLGTTPLRKVPLPVATYRLRVVDPDGASRLLSAPIKPGEHTEMTVRVGDLPLWEEP